MPQITYATKSDGDLWTPSEINEVKSVVSGNHEWATTLTYGLNELIPYLGITYKSIQAANIGNTPVTDGSTDLWWEEVKTGGGVETEGVIAGITTVNKLMYFSTDGKLYDSDNRELSKSFVAGALITATTAINENGTVLSSGLSEGWTGLVSGGDPVPGTDYYLGNSGNLIEKGAVAYTEYIVYIGRGIDADTLDLKIRGPEPTRNQDDGTPISALVKFPVYKDRTGQGYLPYTHDSFSQANYSNLFSEIGHVYNDMHVSAGGTDLSASGTLFYATPIPGYYERGGTEDTTVIDSTADVDDTTELITLTTSDYDALHMTRGVLGTGADGVPIRLKLVSGALPTGLAIDTTYFIRFKTTPDIELYTDEASAIDTAATTNRIDLTDAVGTFQITQEGIALDDAFQAFKLELGRRPTAGTALKALAGADSDTPDDFQIFDQNIVSDGINGTPRTTNETRPKTVFSFGYIKAEHITTAGEPISSLRYVQDWSSTSTWTAGASITINHGLGVAFDEYKGQIFVRDDLVSDKIYNVTDYNMYISAHYGQILNGIGGDLNNCYLQIGATSGLYTSDTGIGTQVPTTGWSYKIILTKPNLVAIYADTSFRKVYDITTATDETYALPDASTQLTEFFIKRRGSGTGVVNFTTVSSQTINGNVASSWGLAGNSDITLLPVSGNWEVKDMNGFRFHVQDQKAANVDGGDSVVGLNIRDLNTTLIDALVGASISSDQITLFAGTYKIDVNAPTLNGGRHFIQLYNITDSSSEIEGVNHYANPSSVQAERALMQNIFIISTTKVFEIRHYMDTATLGNGLGVGSNTELGNSVERYTDVTIEKIG